MFFLCFIGSLYSDLESSESFKTVFQFRVVADTFNLVPKNLLVSFELLYFPEQ